MEDVKVNLISILKYAPKGTKLYSPICGECKYDGYTSESIHTDQLVFNYFGEYFDGCETLLYPSKTHRNWINWQDVLFTPGTFITKDDETLLVVNWKGCYNSKGETVTVQYPTEWGFATNDEIEKFHNELRSHEYTYTVKDGLRKVKPKFKENDFVVGPDAHVYQIVAVASVNYGIIDVRSNTRKIETKKIDDIDKYYHPWTIKDAIAGDILVTGKVRRPYVFKGTFVDDRPQGLCGIVFDNEFMTAPSRPCYWSMDFSYPATFDEKKSFLDRVVREGWILDLGKLTITKDDSLKVKSKVNLFEKDDYIVDKYAGVFKVIKVYPDVYELENIKDSCIEEVPARFVNGNFHLWSEKDIKPGMVLLDENENPFICDQICTDKNRFTAYCGLDSESKFVVGNQFNQWISDGTPASRKDIELLFKVMKDQGYGWDYNNLRLIDLPEIKQVPNECHTDADSTVDTEHILAPYHPNRLEPFDKVLVRDYDAGVWIPDFFLEYHENGDQKFHTMIEGQGWVQCIPFNRETIKLCGTTDKCSPKYIFW